MEWMRRPADGLKRTVRFRELRARPLGTRTQAPSMAKQPQRQTLETVRSGALQEQALRLKPPQKRGRESRHQPDGTTGISRDFASTQPFSMEKGEELPRPPA